MLAGSLSRLVTLTWTPSACAITPGVEIEVEPSFSQTTRATFAASAGGDGAAGEADWEQPISKATTMTLARFIMVWTRGAAPEVPTASILRIITDSMPDLPTS